MVFQEQLIKSLQVHGSRTAIEKGGKQISFSEVLHTANIITRFLLQRSIKRQTIIGLLIEDRLDFICAMIGIANAGCVFVPLDVNMPERRFAALVAELNLGLVISSGNCLQNAIGQVATMKQWLIQDIMMTADGSAPEYPAYDKNDALYIYFTSGSTGKPKGIVGKNCSLLQFIQWEINEFRISSNTRVSQLISPYFDACLRDIFVPLLAGGTICLPPDDDDFYSAQKIIPWIEDSAINLIHCVPSVFRIINNDGLTVANFPSLQHVLLSGEKIIPSELAGWYNVFGERIQLVNLYGTTETTMVRTFYRIRPADTRQNRLPVGLPIADTEILISRKDLKACEPLESGEVHIVSEFVTKGYLNDPELTHERFLSMPGKTGSIKAFKTGDAGRKLMNGIIDLMGREDRQIKIRGIRIEPGEIESVLMGSGYIKNALVVNHSYDGNASLIAFVVRKEEYLQNVDIEMAGMEYAKSRLPLYMLPEVIKEIKAFPLLSNGKINYKELLGTLEVKVIVEPVNETETRLLNIWKQIVGEKILSTEDTFHKVGGNSLAIMKLIGLIYKEFNIRVSLQDIFSNMTIKNQALLITRCAEDVKYHW